MPADQKSLPKLVLSKIMVSDVLDESGLSTGDAIGSRKCMALKVTIYTHLNSIKTALQAYNITVQ